MKVGQSNQQSNPISKGAICAEVSAVLTLLFVAVIGGGAWLAHSHTYSYIIPKELAFLKNIDIKFAISMAAGGGIGFMGYMGAQFVFECIQCVKKHARMKKVDKDIESLKVTEPEKLSPTDQAIESLTLDSSATCSMGIAELQDSYYEKDLEGNCSRYASGVGRTYYAKKNGNNDFPYIESKHAIGIIIDGVGHNNPQSRSILGQAVLKWISASIVQLQERLTTVEQGKKFLVKALELFQESLKASSDQELNDRGDTFLNSQAHPAMSCALIINENGNKKLLYVHFADTMLVIKRANGTIDILKSPRKNLGIGPGMLERISPQMIETLSVSMGDQIYGFSDGIGEYFSEEGFKEALESVSDKSPQEIVGNLIHRIMNYQTLSSKEYQRFEELGNYPKEDRKAWEQRRKELLGNNDILAVNGVGIKTWEKDNIKAQDDVGYFFMEVS